VRLPYSNGHITSSQYAEVGDYVEQDEEIATIETDKIDVAVNAPEAGTIKEFLVNEEDTVTVGQEIVKLEAGGAPEGGKKEASEQPKEPASKDQETSSQPEGQQEQSQPKEEQSKAPKEESKPEPPKQESKPQPPKQESKPAPPKKDSKAEETKPATPGSREERRVCTPCPWRYLY
jgi:2-oxoglutarate dehydrogenase E2 component (dihydrolipoamide succinyltransferase)